jgi:hypothetical protein
MKNFALTLVLIMAIGSLAFIPGLASADSTYSGIWVRMNGFITKWGNETVFGWLRAFAYELNLNGTTKESAMVHAMWTEEPMRLNVTQDPTGTFSFSYYTARLVNVSTIEFNSSSYTLFISGLWNVNKFTNTLTINMTDHLVNFSRSVQQILTEAPGSLSVPASSMKFDLSISGIDDLSGFIRFQVIKFRQVNIFDVSGPSGTSDGRVDIYDLVSVARAYGAVPGMKGYSFDMDFNMQGKIGIDDLTTIAANIGS